VPGLLPQALDSALSEKNEMFAREEPISLAASRQTYLRRNSAIADRESLERALIGFAISSKIHHSRPIRWHPCPLFARQSERKCEKWPEKA
jgi:hypothetical protein